MAAICCQVRIYGNALVLCAFFSSAVLRKPSIIDKKITHLQEPGRVGSGFWMINSSAVVRQRVKLTGNLEFNMPLMVRDHKIRVCGRLTVPSAPSARSTWFFSKRRLWCRLLLCKLTPCLQYATYSPSPRILRMLEIGFEISTMCQPFEI